MRLLALVIVAFLGGAVFQPIQATVLDFEEPGLGIPGSITNEVGFDSRGLRFSDNMEVVDITSPGLSWPVKPAHSGLFAAINAIGGNGIITRVDGGLFTFHELWMRNWWADLSQEIVFRAYRDGVEVGSVNGTINDQWTLVDGSFDDKPIDRLVVNTNAIFLLDDISISAVPEPNSVALALVGVLAAFGFVRRRKI